jgi:hypothetical protein
LVLFATLLVPFIEESADHSTVRFIKTLGGISSPSYCLLINPDIATASAQWHFAISMDHKYRFNCGTNCFELYVLVLSFCLIILPH